MRTMSRPTVMKCNACTQHSCKTFARTIQMQWNINQMLVDLHSIKYDPDNKSLNYNNSILFPQHDFELTTILSI